MNAKFSGWRTLYSPAVESQTPRFTSWIPAPPSSSTLATDDRTGGQHATSGRVAPFIGQSTGLVLASLTIAAVVVRQLTSNAIVPAPLTKAEAAIGVNAYARLQLAELRVPSSLSNDFASWQLSGYSYLSSATERHDSLAGPTRELVIVASVLTAALIVGVCRRLGIGWFSTTLAVSLSGVPAAAALLRIVSPAASISAFWITLAALAAVAATHRSPSDPHLTPGGRRRIAVPLLVFAAGAAVVGVMTAEVAALLVLGLVFAAMGTHQPYGRWRPGLRVFAVVAASVALLAAFWVGVLGPAVSDDDVSPVELVGVVVPPGGLLVAAACSLIDRLRPIAFGAIPLLVAAAWPGSEQASALVLGLTVVSVLIASLLDELLGRRRDSPGILLGAVSLVGAVVVGVFVLPLPQPVAATVTSTGEVATWIQTQLLPEELISVDPPVRAQLVRNGLDPARLSTPNQTGRKIDFVLGPLYDGSGLPLIARFGSGSAELGLRLVVPDSAAYTAALIEDEAARSRFGAELAESTNLALSANAITALAAGDVDARLMAGLAEAASSTRFTITRFTGTVGDLDNGNIFRQVTLTDIADLDPPSNAGQPAVRRLTDFFQTQESPFQPLAVLEVGNTLTIRYAAPSPLGLLA